MNKIIKVMKTSFITNLFLSVMKIVIGFIGTSSALVADGVHSLSDLITDAVAIIGIKFSNKPADKKHPYGYGEAEYLSSFIMGLIIIGLGLGIIFNIANSSIEKPEIIVIIISLIAIFVKYVLLKYLIKKGTEYNDEVLISSGQESRADELSAVIVLITSILSQYSDKLFILKYADIVGSTLISILVVATGFKIVKDSISMILGEQETDCKIVEKIEKIILEDSNVKKISNLIVLKYGPYYKITGDVFMKGNLSLKNSYQIIDQIERNLKKSKLKAKYINLDIKPLK